MKKLLVSIICLFMLTSCGTIEMVLETTENFLKENKSNPDYPVVTYEIENIVDGKYTVVYKLRTWFPDTLVDVKVKKSDDVIYEYGSDWKGTIDIPEDISVWNTCKTLPEKIVYLFEYDGGDVYYIQNNTPLSTDRVTPYKPICKIVYDGENVPDCMRHNSLYIDMYTFNTESQQETNRKTAGFLRENITEQEIIDIFDKCGYDDQYILEIYRYSGKDCLYGHK